MTAATLGAVALLGSAAGTAAAHEGPKNHSKSPGSVNLGLNVCGNPLLIPVLSPPVQNYCKNKF
ncbi:chaplin [Streptomyces oryzae]|uniref:Chaplin n=1 Tax=Streptomyces oryzae TaxID=1434886 RepID=A0ABS3XKQ1_9ACTN|nr:chaplin [Streptomyces oryzae]